MISSTQRAAWREDAIESPRENPDILHERILTLLDALDAAEKESAHWHAQTHKAVEIALTPPYSVSERNAALTACLEGPR